MRLRLTIVFIALALAVGVVYYRTGPAAAQEPSPTAGMKGVNEIIFAERGVCDDPHWYANIGYKAYDPSRKNYLDGGKLCKLDLTTGKVTALIDDPKGSIRDPQVNYDGNGSSSRGGVTAGRTTIYIEINSDGTGLRQITSGPYNDFEPTYISEGGIVFVSTRCNRWVNCWLTPVANIYKCDSDGKNIHPISCNTEQDNTPWPLPDGRIIYMRWEYVDRSQVDYHHLWTMNPDGTGQMVYYGNFHPSTVMLDSKPIPGTDKVVSIFSPGHGIKGARGVRDHRRPEERAGLDTVRQEGERPHRPRPVGIFGRLLYGRKRGIDRGNGRLAAACRPFTRCRKRTGARGCGFTSPGRCARDRWRCRSSRR